MERIAPTAAQAAALQKNMEELQRYWNNNVLPQVGRRWVWWRSIGTRARAYGVDMDAIFGADLVARNNRLNDEAVRYAGYMVMLANGALQVQPWSVPTEKGPLLRMSFIARDSALSGPWWTGHRRTMSGLDHHLGALPALLMATWALAPGIVTFAVRAVIGTGVFVLADAWLTGRRAEMEAAEAYEETRTKAMQTIAEVSKRDPSAGAALAKALNDSVLKANQSPVDDLISAVTEGVRGVTSGDNTLLLLGLAWIFSQSQRKAS